MAKLIRTISAAEYCIIRMYAVAKSGADLGAMNCMRDWIEITIHKKLMDAGLRIISRPDDTDGEQAQIFSAIDTEHPNEPCKDVMMVLPDGHVWNLISEELATF